MGIVFFSVGMSLDGFVAPEGMDLAHADDPGYNDWLTDTPRGLKPRGFSG